MSSKGSRNQQHYQDSGCCQSFGGYPQMGYGQQMGGYGGYGQYMGGYGGYGQQMGGCGGYGQMYY